MASLTRRWWLLAAAALASVSAAVLVLLASGVAMPSAIRNPLADFVQPGIAVWWLVFGGPFRTIPYSAWGIAFAAAINAGLWWLVLRIAALIVRAIQRSFAARRS